jgi:hypothetical protein
MFIAADSSRQALNCAAAHGFTGDVWLLCGARAATLDAPVKLEPELIPPADIFL